LLNIFKPASIELQKYIAHYYVFTAERPENISYIAFPHIYTGLSFFRDVRVTRGAHEIQIEGQQNGGLVHVEILGKYKKPVMVHYRGSFEEVAIIFKPLGIGPFIRSNSAVLTKEFSQALNLENWTLFSKTLFSEPETAVRISMLDEFLLANLCKPAEDWLTTTLDLLEDQSSNLTIAEIAGLVKMNLKTFQRHFFKNIGRTPGEYRRIARFRSSMNTKLLSGELKSLTEITYVHQYFDQSYFIKEFKKLTNLNPRSFFNSITVLDRAGIMWHIR
jgi:AraC-like DNA-binding protein